MCLARAVIPLVKYWVKYQRALLTHETRPYGWQMLTAAQKAARLLRLLTDWSGILLQSCTAADTVKSSHQPACVVTEPQTARCSAVGLPLHTLLLFLITLVTFTRQFPGLRSNLPPHANATKLLKPSFATTKPGRRSDLSTPRLARPMARKSWNPQPNGLLHCSK